MKKVFTFITFIVIFSASSVISEAGLVGDINNDGKIGLEEAIYALQVCAGIKSPSELPPPNDEQAIRDFYAEMKARVESHDLDGLVALFALDYVHEAEDFCDMMADPPDLSEVQAFDFSIQDIVISGNTAKVYGTVTIRGEDGRPLYSWSEPDTTGDSDGLGWLKKTKKGWMVFGNQVRAKSYFNTGHNTTPGQDHYFFRARTITPRCSPRNATVTFTGPYIPNSILDLDCLYGGYKAFVTPSSLPPVGTEYTFIIEFPDGSRETLHDTVRSYVPTAPDITVTPGQGTVTISWNDVTASVPNADSYMVDVWGEGVFWRIHELPLRRSSVIFNEDGTARGVLESGSTYQASVYIFNKFGDYAYRIVSFTMP